MFCKSVINVSCLEAVIDHCDIKPAKEEPSHYMTTVDGFSEATVSLRHLDCLALNGFIPVILFNLHLEMMTAHLVNSGD